MAKPRVEVETDEMTGHELDRMEIMSFSQLTKPETLRKQVRALVNECRRLQGALLIERATRKTPTRPGTKGVGEDEGPDAFEDDLARD